MTDPKILLQARNMIDQAIKNDDMLVLIGLPPGTDTSNDPDRSEDTEGKCTRCKTPVISTVLKDTVLKLTADWPLMKRPVLLCGDCLKIFMTRIVPAILPKN